MNRFSIGSVSLATLAFAMANPAVAQDAETGEENDDSNVIIVTA